MPTIFPNLVPSVEAGNLFSTLTNETSVSVRWLTNEDPVFFEVANRPIADVVVRQLMIAKSVDAINLRLSHQAYFPFIHQAKVVSGTTQVDLPPSWLWDVNVTLPEKWESLRLAKIKRVSGENQEGTDETYDGILRLFFAAEQGNPTEVYIFYADYDIAGTTAYQRAEITVVTDEETSAISATEVNTVAGQVIFRTLSTDEAANREFLDQLPPPLDVTDSNGDGEYDNPSEYEMAPDEAGIFNVAPVSHGSGMLTDSAWNRLPDLGANVDSWIEAFNYPFRTIASRESYTIVGGSAVTIPSRMFNEFMMTAPAGDNDSADANSYPVWITRIKIGEINNEDPNQLTWFFGTYETTDSNTSLSPNEFAYMTTPANGSPGDILRIWSTGNLRGEFGSGSELFNQQLGRGHVVLSSKWGGTEVSEFFDKFPLIVGSNQIEFVRENSAIGPFGLSRIPKYTPTLGQHEALAGTTERWSDRLNPSNDNRYVTELDQGIGDKIDLHGKTNPITGDPIESNPDIEQFGYEGSLLTKSITLIVNAAGDDHDYDPDILPRLRCLFGRDFLHGDEWFDGTRFKRWDSFSNAWVG
jgi:hypothetical protein